MSHIPLDAFFRKPERAIARLSPDGRHVAFLGRWERRMNLFVRQLETGEEHRLTDVARDIVQFVWASSERLAFVIDTEGDENWHVWGVDLAGGAPRNLTPLERVQARLLSDLKALDDVILVSLNDRDARLHDAWRINVATGECSLAAINSGSVSEWLADYSGRVRVAVAVEQTTTKVMARDNEQAPWRTILTCGMLDDITPLWFTADEQRVYAASSFGRPAMAIVEIDLADGQERGVVAEQDALHRRGVAVEYMLKEDEGHGFRNEENEIEFFRAAERFLGEHLTDSMRSSRLTPQCFPPCSAFLYGGHP